MRLSRKFWRAAVFERDRGICRDCRRDCEQLRLSLAVVRASGQFDLATLHRAMRAMGLDPHRPLWESDHDHPLDEGGADALANVVTRCQTCHAKRTAEQAARRGRKRPRPVKSRLCPNRIPPVRYEDDVRWLSCCRCGWEPTNLSSTSPHPKVTRLPVHPTYFSTRIRTRSLPR